MPYPSRLYPLSPLLGAFFFILALLLLMGCQCDSEVLRTNDWVLEQYGPVDAPVNVLDPAAVTPPGRGEIRLRFPEAGRFAGSDGCNSIFGAYALGSSCRITFDSIGTTLMMCQPEIMQQAGAYTTLLKQIDSYTIEGEVLQLLTPDDQLLKYRQE